MTFGRFVNKWRIFRRPLQISLQNVGKIFLCATRLHNFCINEKQLSNESGDSDDDDSDDDEDQHDDDAPPQHRVGVATTTADKGFVPSSVDVVAVQGNSMMRDLLVQEISSEALSRPAHNVRRNQTRNNTNEEE
jgi:hypothetical protein